MKSDNSDGVTLDADDAYLNDLPLPLVTKSSSAGKIRVGIFLLLCHQWQGRGAVVSPDQGVGAYKMTIKF